MERVLELSHVLSLCVGTIDRSLNRGLLETYPSRESIHETRIAKHRASISAREPHFRRIEKGVFVLSLSLSRA